MSQKTVQGIIDRLFTDEEYRPGFLQDPREVLLPLRNQGFDLSTVEIDALLRTDFSVWLDAAARIDPQLQWCNMNED